ncbi:hypothetical protein SHKM778_61720 [Streptomyces sp. KM77-8]|uniref:Uncharacterized protein n=1 Tax=Streptomyces haneummycinicus TaxID=3074435 RepID=A0AAT9HQP8_9ACTN
MARRCTDLLPQLLSLAADEIRHRARGTTVRLDLRTTTAVSAALAALSTAERRPGPPDRSAARLPSPRVRYGTGGPAGGRGGGRTRAPARGVTHRPRVVRR